MGRLLRIALVGALLGGCGPGAQSSVVPQGAIAPDAHKRSWMKPGASSGDLVYVAVSGGDVEVFTYPGGSLVGTLTGFQNTVGLCSDASGNVWVTNSYDPLNPSEGGYLLEYAHGGTSAIATLDDTEGLPQACSIDSNTGNLAVGNIYSSVAVYANAKGSAIYYSTYGVCCNYVTAISYDGSSDIIFTAPKKRPGWLPAGSSQVMRFKMRWRHTPLDWDGKYLTALAYGRGITQMQAEKGYAQKVGFIQLNGLPFHSSDSQYSIQGSSVAVTSTGSVYFFDYPAGGNPTNTITGLDDPYGVAISVTPSRSRRK